MIPGTKVKWEVWAIGPYCMTLIGICESESESIRLGSSSGARAYGDVTVQRHETTVTDVAQFKAKVQP